MLHVIEKRKGCWFSCILHNPLITLPLSPENERKRTIKLGQEGHLSSI